MKHRTYLAAATLSALVATVLSFASCKAVRTEFADPEVTDKLQAKLEQVEQVANAVAATTATTPGLGTIAGISTAVAGIAGLLLNAWRNQTRRTDPTVSNALAAQASSTSSPGGSS